MHDYFGDEGELTGAFRAVRSASLRRLFTKDPTAFSNLHDTYGKRFADRMIADAISMYAPTGQKVPLHFPMDLKSIDCFAVDMRGVNNPLHWRYIFEVQNQAIDQNSVLSSENEIDLHAVSNEKKPEEFVTSFTGIELSRIFSSYQEESPHYQAMATSVQSMAELAQAQMAKSVIDKAGWVNVNQPKRQP